MGQLIKGDPRGAGRLYRMAEICEATGVKASTLRSRAKTLGIRANKGGFTYEEVLRMIQTPKRLYGGKKRPEAVEQLLRQLGKDGYR